jgi:hypothetical protein
LLLVGKLAPFLPAYGVTFVDHGRIVRTNRAAHDNARLL